jgi:hypothetical protein
VKITVSKVENTLNRIKGKSDIAGEKKSDNLKTNNAK